MRLATKWLVVAGSYCVFQETCMRYPPFIPVWLILFFFFSSFAYAGEQAKPSCKVGEIFSTIPQVFDAQKKKDKIIKRKRFVKVAFDKIESRKDIPEQMLLNLFDDAIYTAVFDRLEKNLRTGFAWIGHLEGVDRSQVVLIIADGMLTGTVSMPGANFQVRGVDGTLHVIEEMDHSQFPPESDPIESPEVSTQEDGLNLSIEVSGDEGCGDITVLVAYTPEARAAAGGTVQIENLIALAVTETNQSYINSGINARISLVHTMETTPGDATNSFGTDLGRVRTVGDGSFNDVDAARETYYADAVALIIENNSYCGLGYLDSSAAYAFTVTHRTCATGYYSFGHELGHNMGARHDWYVDGNSSYQKAYVNRDDRWRTVMGYNSVCSHNGFNCSRIQYWSNPDVIYGGDPMGVSSAGPTNCSSGSLSPDPASCAADNRTKLNSTCSTVANFRNSPVAMPDLVVTSPGVDSSSLTTGQAYTLSATVENQGADSADATTMRYYLSPNAIISTDDTPLGTDAVPSLASGSNLSKSTPLNAPTSAGTYYVGACVESVAGEVTTGNNCSSGVELTVTGASIPDLSVISPMLDDASLTPAQTISISMAVENHGSAVADATILRYFRSADATISGADTLVGTDTVVSLAAGASSLECISVSAPTTEGDYWIGACVDTVASEVVTSNNCSSGFKISVGNPFPWWLFQPQFHRVR